MSLERPSPRSRGRRGAENRDVEKRRITKGLTLGCLLLRTEHRFASDAHLDSLVTAVARSGSQKLHGQPLLRFAELPEHNPGSNTRRFLPDEPFLVIETQHSLRTLLRCERREKRVGGLHHRGRGFGLCVGSRGPERNDGNNGKSRRLRRQLSGTS
jgi:hypothetical protein